MDEQWTCGQGLAENAALPGLFAEIIAALAENLEVHLEALELTDEHSRTESDVYQDLARKHRDLSGQLLEVTDLMASYASLPMGRHDERKMASPRVIEAFEKLMEREADLHQLLALRANQHRTIRSSMFVG